MKKRILFIISNFETGGVSKSMTSLMNIIDRERYDVSLMIVSPVGALMELLPKDLRIITNPVWNALTDQLAGLPKLLRLGHPLLAIGHCLRLATGMFSKSWAGRMIAAMMPAINEDFDLIVDYNGQHQLYYMVDKLKAKKKITFFHSDYKKWPYYYNADKKYFPMVDSVWTISDTCADSLKEMFPQVAGRVRVLENISSLALIKKMAEHMNMSDIINPEIPSIITVGHLCENKGTHWAIEAAGLLKKRGVKFRWYFLGSNTNEVYYDDLRRLFGVETEVVFLGIKVNPYPYIKAATIAVHASQFEGKSIALDEMKLLCKPVVVTNFSTVSDQFADRVNASICQMTPCSIADAIDELLSDVALRQRYIDNLRAEAHDNSSEVEKLYRIVDND